MKLAAAATAGLTIGSLGAVESDRLELVDREIALENWDANGIRIAFLSDFHLTTPWALDRALRALAMALDAKPDVLIFGGDFIGGDLLNKDKVTVQATRVSRLAEEASLADCPVLAVLGNHDYITGYWNLMHVVNALRATKVKLLINESFEMGGVVYYGYDDALFGHFRPDQTSIPMGAKSVVGILHEPDYADSAPETVSIVVSGHTHGGQICLPGGIPLDRPTGGRRYTAGLYDGASAPVYVSRGVGTRGLDWRFCCPPEVTILTLRSA
jgi:hypothetical protein